MSGKVTLVGAGPGELGLLTLKGSEVLKKADVVIYDRLVGEDILKLIPDCAEKIDAGKQSSMHKIPQEDINKLLLEKAKEGKNVVRLKGGDCFLFGRGGEELELLAENNIDFEVVPGVTSALSVPAYAGIPVTHRDYVSSVHIITGHQKKNEELKINYKSCVECGGTLIFLMGVANTENIMTGLMSDGMREDMPCAVIEQGTSPMQRKVVGTVSSIKSLCDKENIKSPAVIVVGEVCGLSNKLDWFDRLPLKGISVVVTRPRDRAGTFGKRLKALGAEVIEFPCINTVSIINNDTLNTITDKINQYDIIVFTSPFGVKSVFEAFKKHRIDARIFACKKIAVIGSATGRELEKYGLFPDYMPDKYDGESLGRLIAERSDGKKVLLLRARDGSSDITDILTSFDICYEDIPVYFTKYRDTGDDAYLTERIKNGSISYVTFTSSSTVKAFVSAIKCEYKFKGICIGEKTNSEALKYGIKTIVSPRATIDDMIDTLCGEVKKCR